MIKARLIEGQDYVVRGQHFRNGVALPINDKLKEYLVDNKQFEIIEDEDEESQDKKKAGAKGQGTEQEGDK